MTVDVVEHTCVGYGVGMRIHILIDDEVLRQLDDRVGRGNRSAFVVEAVRRALDERSRWDAIVHALGYAPRGDWGDDPGTWVREGRRADPRRVG